MLEQERIYRIATLVVADVCLEDVHVADGPVAGSDVDGVLEHRIVEQVEDTRLIIARKIDDVFSAVGVLVALRVNIVHRRVGRVEQLVELLPDVEALSTVIIEGADPTELVPVLVGHERVVVQVLVMVVGLLVGA